MADTLSDLLQGATLSTSGTDITILCSDHDTKDAIFNALESAQNWHEMAVLKERFRCIALCDGWINSFKHREIKYVGAREYAIDAIRDIMDLISDGQEVAKRKSTAAVSQL